MLAFVKEEALRRLIAAKAVLRMISSHESTLGVMMSDDASRSAKGMMFVYNYAI